KIPEAIYSAQHGGEFSMEKLIDTSRTSEGEVAGIETIRRLVFQAVDKQGFSPEMMGLTRKMLSNDALTRAIMEHFQIDTTTTTLSDGTNIASIDQLFAYLGTVKQQYAAATDEATQ